MESQGPFDIVVHKLSDVIVEAEHDSQSQQLLDNFQVTQPDITSTHLIHSMRPNNHLVTVLLGKKKNHFLEGETH